jgi:hypothetical protein
MTTKTRLRKYLLTLVAAAGCWLATFPALGAGHDCATFSMGAGGYFFAGPLIGRMNQFKAANPRANVALYPYWMNRSLRGCKNPLYVGHSMGAFASIAQANADGKGRVVSIDPPSWKAGSERTGGTGTVSRRPTDHLFQCTEQFGCGRVTGPAVKKKDLTFRRLGHVALPNAPEVGAAVLR